MAKWKQMKMIVGSIMVGALLIGCVSECRCNML